LTPREKWIECGHRRYVTGVRTVTLRLNVSANLERPMSIIGLSVFSEWEAGPQILTDYTD